MIPDFPLWLNVVFIFTTILVLVFYVWANTSSSNTLALLVFWIFLQAILAYYGFYQDFEASPSRFILVLLPPTLLMLYALLSRRKKQVLKHRRIERSTFLHVVRIPVEICLYYLYVHGWVPELMTFEGRNFDILAGITAPIVGYLFLHRKIKWMGLFIWNCIGLILVTFILVNGLLSAELPFQQFAFDQPNRALAYFPFILLPAVVVPTVIYTHITDLMLIWRHLKGKMIT